MVCSRGDFASRLNNSGSKRQAKMSARRHRLRGLNSLKCGPKAGGGQAAEGPIRPFSGSIIPQLISCYRNSRAATTTYRLKYTRRSGRTGRSASRSTPVVSLYPGCHMTSVRRTPRPAAEVPPPNHSDNMVDDVRRESSDLPTHIFQRSRTRAMACGTVWRKQSITTLTP